MPSRRRAKEFSLIEMLVVITVLAALIAISSSVLSGVFDSVRRMVCLSNSP